ncbi:hypothetical protein ACIBJF_39730 [Streptomyces sp. NPDC050743]|uniref:hypothetical protein n=1 Tax=Streptomyces sp. NPDC050743 TaxID=3365634 RepID=UPI00378A4807
MSFTMGAFTGMGLGFAVHRRIRLSAGPAGRLVACGTRAVIDAVFGPRQPGEPVLGRRVLRGTSGPPH